MYLGALAKVILKVKTAIMEAEVIQAKEADFLIELTQIKLVT